MCKWLGLIHVFLQSDMTQISLTFCFSTLTLWLWDADELGLGEWSNFIFNYNFGFQQLWKQANWDKAIIAPCCVSQWCFHFVSCPRPLSFTAVHFHFSLKAQSLSEPGCGMFSSAWAKMTVNKKCRSNSAVWKHSGFSESMICYTVV